MTGSLTLACALLAAAAPTVVGAAGTVTAERFVLLGRARFDLGILPASEEPVDVLALVAPGDTPGSVRLHLRARGYECVLDGRVHAAGELAIPAGQVCRLALDQPDARGSVDARLRSAVGRLGPGELSLRLAWDVTGVVRRRVELADVAAGWSPEVPVRGSVEGDARGTADVPAPRPPAGAGPTPPAPESRSSRPPRR